MRAALQIKYYSNICEYSKSNQRGSPIVTTGAVSKYHTTGHPPPKASRNHKTSGKEHCPRGTEALESVDWMANLKIPKKICLFTFSKTSPATALDITITIDHPSCIWYGKENRKANTQAARVISRYQVSAPQIIEISHFPKIIALIMFLHIKSDQGKSAIISYIRKPFDPPNIMAILFPPSHPDDGRRPL